jgi:protocatechuate 3,4-dioxygenase beta subunit
VTTDVNHSCKTAKQHNKHNIKTDIFGNKVTTGMMKPTITRTSTCFKAFVLLVVWLPFSSYGQQCSSTETPDDQLGPFYVAGSEMSNRIAPEDLLADPNQRFFVYGKVLKTGTCEGVPDIVVEAWYAGPPDAENDYYQTNEYRGQVVTNALGEYNFTQIFPALYPTRPILHNHFRLSTAAGEELLVTQMYFYGTGNGYVTDRSTRTLQAVDTTMDDTGGRQAEFNMYIDDTSGSDNGLIQRLIALIQRFFASIF